MKRGHLLLFSTVIALLVTGVIGSTFFFISKVDTYAKPDEQAAEQITTYFIFDNDNPNDGMRGSQFFGGQHKLGVRMSVRNSLPNRNQDFLAIANKSEARQQFLLSNSKTLDLQRDRWQVRIIDSGTFNGEVRVCAVAMLGYDEPRMNGAIGLHSSHTMSEIWKLNPGGEPPVLLDRSFRSQVGLATTTEVPPPPLPELPSGIFHVMADAPPGSISSAP